LFPDLFSTLAVPKAEELVAFAYRHDGKSGAEKFFLNGMTQAMRRLAEQAHPGFPVTIYSAFKQSENDGVESTASTGWETFLDQTSNKFEIDGPWAMRTERPGRCVRPDQPPLPLVLFLFTHVASVMTGSSQATTPRLSLSAP
jgi:putative DNA methylase